MESNLFKTTAFGGFDRQSVIDYIEKTSRESAELTERLQRENEALRGDKTALEAELEVLRRRTAELEGRAERLDAELAAQRTARESAQRELERVRPRVAELEEQVERLRPEAEAYVQVKTHIGDIECGAQKRADELEASVTARLAGLAAAFKAQYEELRTTFDVTSSHVVGELRKVEVNLSQLPRTFDKMGSDLAELEGVLKKD